MVTDAITANAATLVDADISDIIAGRPEAEVLAVLRSVAAALKGCELASLNISDNALGEKGVRACGNAMSSQAGLRAIYLENIGCSVNACAAVNELVACSTLEKVHLFNNMSDDAGAQSIAALLSRSPNMQARARPSPSLRIVSPCGMQDSTVSCANGVLDVIYCLARCLVFAVFRRNAGSRRSATLRKQCR